MDDLFNVKYTKMLSFSLVAEALMGLIYHRPSGKNSKFAFCKKKNPNKKGGCCYCWRLYCQRAERLANVQNQEC